METEATELPRVNEFLLEYEDDLLSLDGEPFTGIVYSEYSNKQLESEELYENGLPNGLCRTWHENGQLKQEWFADRGRATGIRAEWHDNGRLKSIIYSEYGIVLDRREWDVDGTLKTSERTKLSAHQASYLEKMRKAGAK